MLTNANHSATFVANTFCCKICDYATSRKNNLDKHLSTTKHKNANKMLTNATKVAVTETTDSLPPKPYCCDACSKAYSHKSSFSRHKKTCKERNVKIDKKVEKDDKIMMEMIKTMQGMIPKMGNNNNNNKISINVYLNEHCKDALNLTDFVEKIRFSLKDLCNSEKNGGVQTISDVFIKYLSDVPPNERPIHCSDKKRAQFYVKDENKWAKDSENQKIDNTIMHLHNKQLSAVDQEFRSKNSGPDWATGADGERYINIIRKTAWDSNAREKNKNTIRKNIAHATDIKQAIKCVDNI